MKKRREKTPTKENAPTLLSRKALSEMSGVPFKRIRTYIDAGLLPGPDKKRGKTPYYNTNCVSLVNLIDTFHAKYNLPIKTIKQVLQEMGHERVVTEGCELEKRLNRARELPWFERDADIDNEPMLTKRALILASGLSPKELSKAIEQKMIIPGENGLFSKNDLEMALTLARLKKTDVKNGPMLLDFLAMQLQAIETLVDREFDAFFQNVIKKNITVEDANVMAEKALEVVRALLPISYKKLLNRKVEEISKKTPEKRRQRVKKRAGRSA